MSVGEVATRDFLRVGAARGLLADIDELPSRRRRGPSTTARRRAPRAGHREAGHQVRRSRGRGQVRLDRRRRRIALLSLGWRRRSTTTTDAPAGPPIRAACHAVNDPEIHRPITELGMVEAVDVDGARRARVTVLLTVSGCPMRETLTRDVTAAVERGRRGSARSTSTSA